MANKFFYESLSVFSIFKQILALTNWKYKGNNRVNVPELLYYAYIS
jgi:hypothetical protein